MEVTVFNISGKAVEKIKLDAEIWGKPVNVRLLSQAIGVYRSNLRAGTASTKTRANVSGGGTKPWKQKHTGRARAGSIRSPLWRHGGVVFGPHPRTHRAELPKAMRSKALLESLKGKIKDEEIIIIDQLEANEPKIKPFVGLAKVFSITKKSAIVLDKPSQNIIKSLRNLDKFKLHRCEKLNAFDVLNTQKVVVTKSAFEHLTKRAQG